MRFDDINRLMTWYVEQSWVRPPRSPGNHDLVAIHCGLRMEDVIDLWETHFKIAEMLETFPRYKQEILEAYYRHLTYYEISKLSGISQRTVRRWRPQLIHEAAEKSYERGLISTPKYTEVIYERG